MTPAWARAGLETAMQLLEEQELAEVTAARMWYRGMIDYVKAEVGEGAEYVNNLVRVVLSERGCYYQFRESPEEFSGVLGDGFSHEFMGTRQGLDLYERVHEVLAAPRDAATRELSLTALYPATTRDERDLTYEYTYEAEPQGDDSPAVSGRHRPGVLPVFFKLRARSPETVSLVGGVSGALFFIAYLTDQHLLVRVPHLGAQAADLGAMPGPVWVH